MVDQATLEWEEALRDFLLDHRFILSTFLHISHPGLFQDIPAFWFLQLH